jgi:hypothetical protein
MADFMGRDKRLVRGRTSDEDDTCHKGLTGIGPSIHEDTIAIPSPIVSQAWHKRHRYGREIAVSMDPVDRRYRVSEIVVDDSGRYGNRPPDRDASR